MLCSLCAHHPAEHQRSKGVSLQICLCLFICVYQILVFVFMWMFFFVAGDVDARMQCRTLCQNRCWMDSVPGHSIGKEQAAERYDS